MPGMYKRRQASEAVNTMGNPCGYTRLFTTEPYTSCEKKKTFLDMSKVIFSSRD